MSGTGQISILSFPSFFSGIGSPSYEDLITKLAKTGSKLTPVGQDKKTRRGMYTEVPISE